MENLLSYYKSFVCEDIETNIDLNDFLSNLHELMNDCIIEYNKMQNEFIEIDTITNLAKDKEIPNAGYYAKRLIELNKILPKYKSFLDSFKILIKKKYDVTKNKKSHID